MDKKLWRSVLVLIVAVGLGYYFFGTQKQQTTFIFQGNNGMTFSYGANPNLARADYFRNIKEEMIKNGLEFIEADLSAMEIKVYKGEEILYEAPIKTKGKVGSWWETPAGLYKVELKEKSHFSSFGHVYTPWNIQFQGNFFIHGWPYYPDGTPVEGTYSGGCIRLSDEDAKAIYDLVERGVPVLVFEKDFESDNWQPVEKSILEEVTAEQYLAADLKSGFVYFKKGEAEVRPIASITKLITALVAAEYINLEKEITVTEAMIVHTSKPRLKVGMKTTPFDLLYPLLLESSNEAGEALARPFGRSIFIQRMNEKAVALGMKHTKLVDPTGSGEGNVATLEDLFNLARYIAYNRSFVFDMSAGRASYTAYGTTSFTGLSNFNDFNIKGFLGGKVGQTTVAKETAMMVYKMEINGEEREVMVGVLGSEDREGDVVKLVKAILEKYE